MVKDRSENNKVNIIDADKSLQRKVGTGPLDERIVELAERAMKEDSDNVDFKPLAEEYLDQLAEAIEKAKAGQLDKNRAIQVMTTPVMQLKANSKTFNYDLIGKLANIMLSFLEAIENLDSDVVTIVAAHHKTLSLIVSQDLRGEGGVTGQQMEEELKAACKRYFTRRS